ncbi:MAG: hypothetical protein WAW52_07325 [Methanothrix sp.]
MRFIRDEFKKVFVPTLRLRAYLCMSQSKCSWVDVTREECEARLER